MSQQYSFTKHLLTTTGGFILGSVATIFVIFCILWYGFFDYPAPWKVTNSNDPRFNVNDFKFTDYSNSKELQDALDFIFPPGTHKSKVDAVLVTRRRTRKLDLKQAKTSLAEPADQIYGYRYNHLRSIVYSALAMMPDTEYSWRVNIIYDENNKLKEIKAFKKGF